MRELLDYLARRPADGIYQQWHIQRIGGSANNILYRATGDKADWAIKFTIRDARRRAAREYNALLALQQIGLTIAPKPIFLDRTSYPQPVVVQTWLAGKVTAVPPQTDAEWYRFISHYAAIHSVTPEKVDVELETAVNNNNSTAALNQMIRQEVVRIPPAHQPASLRDLLRQLETVPSPSCLPAPLTVLCRVDSNSLNILRRPGNWASVDWEYSGWGDPAFDLAELRTHPKYRTVSAARWEWAMVLYAELMGDETAVTRLRTYYPLMLVWWVARLARYLYEVPRGLDERLVKRPFDWRADSQSKYNHYLSAATAVLNTQNK